MAKRLFAVVGQKILAGVPTNSSDLTEDQQSAVEVCPPSPLPDRHKPAFPLPEACYESHQHSSSIH